MASKTASIGGLFCAQNPGGEPNLRSVTNGKSVGNGQCGALVGLQSDFLSKHDVAMWQAPERDEASPRPETPIFIDLVDVS